MEMRLIEILAIALVGSGIVMHFTASCGIGDHQTANGLISAGLGLIGGYGYGRLISYLKK